MGIGHADMNKADKVPTFMTLKPTARQKLVSKLQVT